ncbi:hypothetical protein POX_c03551 [Penicillium oxalicum]|uniref:hypothetical protein n=1 Tax=Penicillium oxalicum TaxID=69781 RepID=UPI0020B77EAE|nr:hypothetical protein POX_c03551 [Penicillium oxalicum]KAI2790705.1 hypothetical protein POX_c03551 [Penicillium oxalicum]
MEENTEDGKSRQPLLIFTYPRTTSNLLMRMLSIPNQSDAVSVESGGYFFLPAFQKIKVMKLLDCPSTQWTNKEWTSLKEVYTSCADNLQGLLRTANKMEKMAVFKEHTPFIISPSVQASFVHEDEAPEHPWRIDLGVLNDATDVNSAVPYNQSVFPSEFLLKCVPAFLIRHPALAFPSYYRMIQDIRGEGSPIDPTKPIFKQVFTLRWTRNMFDWFLAVNTKSPNDKSPRQIPIVLDADDILTDPKLVLHFCDLVGLDSSKVQFEWDPVPNEELQKEDTIRKHTRSTLLSSTGITPGKTFDGLTVEGEYGKWRIEFGDKVADKLHHWVKTALPDYEYLARNRLQLPS